MIVYVNQGREQVRMNIAAVGGASHHASVVKVAAQRPELAEAPGAPDHDGDSDDVATRAAQASARSVDLRA